jgi:hypothetical protein
VTREQALALIDQTYADKRRESLTMLLTTPGTLDADAIDAHFAEQDRAFERERERFIEWLKSLPGGDAVGAR